MRAASSRLITLGLVLVAVWATAGTITQTHAYGPGTPDFITTLTYNQFNTNGGVLVLDSIQVIFGLTSQGGVYILDNDSTSAASGNFSFGAKSLATNATVPLLNTSFQPVVPQLSAAHSQAFSLDPNQDDGPNDWSPLPPDGLQYTGGTENDTKSGFIANSLFALYSGLGTFSVDVDTSQFSTYGGVSGIEYAVTPVTASGDLTIKYNYHSTLPEPGTASLMFVGLGVLLAARRRRSA